jgi:hypothetical protein
VITGEPDPAALEQLCAVLKPQREFFPSASALRRRFPRAAGEA